MENLLYTSSPMDVINYIKTINKNYEIWIDFKDEIKYIDPEGMIIKQNIVDPIKITYSNINPIFKIYRRTKNCCILKIIIPEFTITFPNLHNLTYTFLENSLDLHLNLLHFTVEYSDIDSYFDNGLEQYLKRTVDSILHQQFISDNGYTLKCSNYTTYVYSVIQSNKKRKNNLS
ncbi:hypothetical protein H8S10_17555 [Clostridium sp. NSJ-49]|uniref:hypothetical protein n=1 Tax=unclassified Clostridium TaxID=2614128 RepID=UPI00164C60DB|nr:MULTISPECIES: hypothetical protein [unclassified Clostridium]MBC5627206.1 hypothetical protein [Clostridium sp. NSJ-49]MCD2500959.1 hypothetical protein [Clostridium sp. NSJ-145]MDU6339694.1 hypothetical protein [Clostridium sp.]